MPGSVHDLGGQDRGHEGEQVELGAERAVLGDPLGQRGAGAAEALVTEKPEPAGGGFGRQRIGPALVGRNVDADDLVAGLEQIHQHVLAEGGLTEERDAQRHLCRVPQRTRERSPTRPRTVAGEPKASECGGMSRVTSERAPITLCSPIVTPRSTVTSEAIQA